MCRRKTHKMGRKWIVDYVGDQNVTKSKKYISWLMNKPMALGLGDVILPGACIASFAVNYGNLWLFALVGACAGLLGNMYLLFKLRRAIPALPSIFLGMIILVGIGLLFL